MNHKERLEKEIEILQSIKSNKMVEVEINYLSTSILERMFLWYQNKGEEKDFPFFDEMAAEKACFDTHGKRIDELKI